MAREWCERHLPELTMPLALVDGGSMPSVVADKPTNSEPTFEGVRHTGDRI
jgi:hypothetical protein